MMKKQEVKFQSPKIVISDAPLISEQRPTSEDQVTASMYLRVEF